MTRIFGLALAAALGFLSAGSTASAATPTVAITASNWQFSPDKIVAHVGETVVLHATSTGGVHSLISEGLGIKDTMLVPGKTVEVSFTPTKPGKYTIHCHLPCGPGHDKMVINVEVLPS